MNTHIHEAQYQQTKVVLTVIPEVNTLKQTGVFQVTQDGESLQQFQLSLDRFPIVLSPTYATLQAAGLQQLDDARLNAATLALLFSANEIPVYRFVAKTEGELKPILQALGIQDNPTQHRDCFVYGGAQRTMVWSPEKETAWACATGKTLAKELSLEQLKLAQDVLLILAQLQASKWALTRLHQSAHLPISSLVLKLSAGVFNREESEYLWCLLLGLPLESLSHRLSWKAA